jgi:hypothetical protein
MQGNNSKDTLLETEKPDFQGGMKVRLSLSKVQAGGCVY